VFRWKFYNWIVCSLVPNRPPLTSETSAHTCFETKSEGRESTKVWTIFGSGKWAEVGIDGQKVWKDKEKKRQRREERTTVEEMVEKTAYSNCTISGANQRSKYYFWRANIRNSMATWYLHRRSIRQSRKFIKKVWRDFVQLRKRDRRESSQGPKAITS